MSDPASTPDAPTIDSKPPPAKRQRKTARNQQPKQAKPGPAKPPGYKPPPKRPRNRRANRGYQADNNGNLPVAAKVDPSLDGSRNKINIGKALKMRMENGNSLSEIARYFGVTKSAVGQALAPFSMVCEKAEAIRAAQDNQATLLDAAKYTALAQYLDKATDQNAQAAAVSYGIFYDKARLERGQSTQNIAITGVIGVLDEVQRAIEDLGADDCQGPGSGD